jgi:hypothetical protein
MLTAYYIVDKATLLSVGGSENHPFDPGLGAAYHDLKDGMVIAACYFQTDHSAIERWEAMPNVEPLPHPVFEGTVPVKDEHVAKLAHLGVQKGHTVLDVARIVGALHPMMKLRNF